MGRPTSLSRNACPADKWRTQGGWYSHAHVPENDHVDPGSWPAFVSQPTDPSSAERAFEPFPGASFLQAGRKSPVIEGCTADWSPKTVTATRPMPVSTCEERAT
jgi:hypothetical protein